MKTSLFSAVSSFTNDSVSLLAHQGGWDEILLVAGPIAVIVALLAIVKKRIDAHVRLATDDDQVDESSRSGAHGIDALDDGTDSA